MVFGNCAAPQFTVLITLVLGAELALAEAQTVEAVFQGARGNYGDSCDIEGSIACVGAPGGYVAGVNTGAVHIYHEDGGRWIEEVVLAPSDGASGDHFGSSVSIYGSRIAVGARSYSAAKPDGGAVYIYERTGSFPLAAWTLVERVLPPVPSTSAFFGSTVLLSGDTLAAGAGGFGFGRGVVHLFSTGSGPTTHVQTLDPPLTSPGDGFGAGLAWSNSDLIVSAPGDDTSANQAGSIYLYLAGSSGWSLDRKWLPSDGMMNDHFGSSMSLEADRLLVGAPGVGVGSGQTPGAVYVLRKSSGSWIEEQKLRAIEPQAPGSVGTAVAWYGDVAIVSNPGFTASGAMNNSGMLYGFARSGSSWDQVGRFHGDSTHKGIGARIATDGVRILATAVDQTIIFNTDPLATVTFCTAKQNSLGCVPSIGSHGQATVTGPDNFLIAARDVLNNKPGILIWSRSATAFPFGGGTLCVAPPIRRTPVQGSGGNPPPSDCSGVYAFLFAQSRMASEALYAGDTFYAQYWSRDPGFVAPEHIGLTDALEITLQL